MDFVFVLGSGDLQALEKIDLQCLLQHLTMENCLLTNRKFKAALESDPEGVKELFTKEQVKDEAGNVVQSSGIATNLKNVFGQICEDNRGSPKRNF